MVKTLTAPEIKNLRGMIMRLEDGEKRKKLFLELQTKVPYHNQRDNNQETDVADRMCNLTSLSACFELLGISNPNPSVQFEDYLEQRRKDNKYDARTKGGAWEQLADYYKVKNKYVGLGSSDKQFLTEILLPFLQNGDGVMLSISTNAGHIVRLQDISDSGLIVDDPYGELTDFAAREAGTKNDYNLNERTEGSNKGNDNLWSWENLKKLTIKYAYVFSL
jgi:hypothetical protein